MQSRRPYIIAAALALVPAVWLADRPDAVLTQSAAAANTVAKIESGRAIAEKLCAACHAVEAAGASPVAKAPPFREIAREYPVRNLEEALAEGIVTGHAAMPAFALNPAEIDALLTFMDTHTPRAK